MMIIKKDTDGLDSLGSEWISLSDITKDNISPLGYESLKKLRLIK